VCSTTLGISDLGHQYELLKIPNTKWSWLIQHRRQYSKMPRGDMVKKFNIEWVPHYEKDKYDVAILHLDQQCVEPEIQSRGKGSLYMQVNSVIKDIPKIVIMHGTPYYPERFPCDITEKDYRQRGFTKDQIGMSSELIRRVKKIVGNNVMVVNSYTAAKQWGFGKPIIHGLDPNEWWDLPKEPRVVTVISPAGLDKYYDRVFLEAVREELEKKGIIHCHITVDVRFNNWDEYREFLGRSLIYFNPTRESPMPRAKTEALLSGCCVVTTPNQDADRYIKNGENGFLIKRNPKDVADLIERLLFDYKTTVKIGKRGRETAIKYFHIDRFTKEWRQLLEDVINNYRNGKKI